MSADHKDEYARSSDKTGALRVSKEALYAEGFPADKTRDLAAQYFQPEKYSHLRGQPDLTYLVAPSTSGENTLPVAFAQMLQQTYGGKIVTNWATPNATRRTATMDGITKLRNPPTYQINRDVTQSLAPNSTLVLVDDVVTTGGSIAALRETLAREGLRVEQITSLAQSDMRKVRDADIDRIVTKLGNPSLRPDVALALDGRLKHFANYIETSIRKTDAERNTEISKYFQNEAQRLRELSRTDTGAVLGIADRIERLEGVQSRESPSTGVQPGLSRESSDLRASPDRQENGLMKHAMIQEMIQKRGNGHPEYIAGVASFLASKRTDISAQTDRSDMFRKGVFDAHDMLGHIAASTADVHAEHDAEDGQLQSLRSGVGLKNDTEAVLDRLDALRAEYEEKPDPEKTEEARAIVNELNGPDVTRIPLGVAAENFVEGHTSRVELEILAAANDRSREVRAHVSSEENSHDAGRDIER
jgi:hypoxanthine phosphoribosyltransferase